MADTGLTVVGAGVVGLAVAARLAGRFPGLVVLERREKPGTETSSRNSEVVHAGLYYPAGSLKARLCVAGNRRVYELAERYGVPHRRTGKLVVAVEEGEDGVLEGLLEGGRANGVRLERLSPSEVRRLEPNVRARAALSSPSTGIVSAHGLVELFLQQAVRAGAVVMRRTELLAVECLGGGYRLTVRTGNGAPESFTSEHVVNAAGLDADTVAALAGIDVDAAGYRLHYCKGRYFAASSTLRGLVSRLVYPAPGPVGLGIHAVLGLDGRLRFGPDAEYALDRRLDYGVDASLRPAFGDAVRRILPMVRDADLEPDTAGIRPKLQGPGDAFRDFVVAEESARGLPGFVNLVGIDSPGLTAAPALAEHVDALLEGRGVRAC
jgi:L-2-hydroxyglutarate oxidase LhgO